MFIKLAKTYFDEDLVKKRWDEYLSFEAELMKTLKPRGDRMH